MSGVDRGAELRLAIAGAAEEDLPRRTWRHNRLVRYLVFDRLNLIGLTAVMLAAMVAIVGPYVVPYNPTTYYDINNMLVGPIRDHPFGTDPIGYDIFSRVLAGARLSLGSAALVLAIAVSVGLSLGAIAGLAGGWIDEIIMRITDMFLAFPVIILALAIAASLGPSLTSAMIALSTVFWPWYARLMRGQVLAIKRREYVEAAHSLGVSRFGVFQRHILPNCLSPIVVEMSLDMGYAILATSSLSFIGLGAQPPSPEWGAMIVAGRDHIRDAWWLSTFPGLALTLTVAGFNLIGDGLRDALDPRAVRR